jgi:cyclophilin family peptidyl-prolyl cis-trans isomerase
VCPIACSNFIKLCTGEAGKLTGTNTKLHYLNCPIHRLVPGGWLQCGDIVDGTGQNSIAAIGENNKIQDENLSIDFSEEMGGMVGYSTSMPHSNGSQFFITLGPCAWMNHKYVGIGRVVQGFKTLKQISSASTKNQKPVETIFISSCGLENQKPVEIP